MTFEEMLLALIARKPSSGYELKKWLEVEGVFIRANADQAQIYRTLTKLTRAHLIAFSTEKRSGPEAKIYRITPAGADRLLELASAPYEPPARWQEADFNARLLLLAIFKPESVLSMIDTEMLFRRDQVAQYRNRDTTIHLSSELLDVDEGLSQQLGDEMNSFGRAAMDHWLEWLERFRAKWVEQLRQRERSLAPSSASSDSN
jgi:DNA-binding PadR family transcriptional regulator